MSKLLVVDNLHVAVEDKALLNGVSFELAAGELCAVMGQNGSGKSTLTQVLAGNPNYKITQGKILFNDKNLAELSPEKRAQLGLFISFQNPIDLPGVRIMSFLQASLNACRKARGEEELNPANFLRLVRQKAEELNMGEEMLRREVNVGFSGGERKRFEALQMLLLEPSFIILDEIDSGLDVDTLQYVIRAIEKLQAQGSSVLLITHYKNLLDRLIPKQIHILLDGKIVRSGGSSLAVEVERSGYELSP